MANKHYDYLIVGSGLSGASIARMLLDAGKTVLILEKRDHVGGNIATKVVEGIPVHVYGPHIFHTSDEFAWKFFNSYAEVYPYINSPKAFYKGKYYSMPFNMNTFHELWGVTTKEEAEAKITQEVKQEGIDNPKNLEEQALSLVGRTIFKTLIKGYTEKQWGKPCNELPASIIKRIPLRFEYNNNYFNDTYQGQPKGGYTPFIKRLLKGADIFLNVDYLEDKAHYDSLADRIIYTGCLDEYFGYCLGRLEWRSLRFDTVLLNQESFQDAAVVNYTDKEPGYTRITEHKKFDPASVTSKTIISYEYPDTYEEGKIPYYVINNERNASLAQRYQELAKALPNVYFLGRLANYRYYDMDDAIIEAKKLFNALL